MNASNIEIKRAIYNVKNITETMDLLSNKLATGKEIESAKDDPVGWMKIKSNRRSFDTLQAINTGLNSAAMNINIVDKVMETIAEYIDQMKAQLERMYDEKDINARNATIDIFNSLCDQINDLTQPENDDGARKIMADPLLVPEAGDLTIIVGERGSEKTIHSQEIHTGPNGLDIPQLAYGLSNNEITLQINNLDSAKEKLRQRQSSLAVEAVSVEHAIEYNSRFANLHLNYAEENETADTMELAAEYNSIELRHTLAVEVIGKLCESQEMLLSLLR